jgi:hypothetical protein
VSKIPVIIDTPSIALGMGGTGWEKNTALALLPGLELDIAKISGEITDRIEDLR